MNIKTMQVKKWMTLGMVLTVLLALPMAAHGANAPVVASESPMLHKLYRGVVNAATGFLEIPNQISQTWKLKGPGEGLTLGFAKGIGYAIARSVSGAYDIVTFPIPAPAAYQPIMQPEFVFSEL